MECETKKWIHFLKITTPGKPASTFNKVSTSESFPKALADVGAVAFYCNDHFKTELKVELSSMQIPDEFIYDDIEPEDKVYKIL